MKKVKVGKYKFLYFLYYFGASEMHMSVWLRVVSGFTGLKLLLKGKS